MLSILAQTSRISIQWGTKETTTFTAVIQVDIIRNYLATMVTTESGEETISMAPIIKAATAMIKSGKETATQNIDTFMATIQKEILKARIRMETMSLMPVTEKEISTFMVMVATTR